jgi:hypothetical protein
MPEEERARKAEDLMVRYLHEMAQGRWPELVPMYLGALADVQGAEGQGDGDGGGLLEALELASGGADAARSRMRAGSEQAGPGLADGCAPEPQSGGRPVQVLPAQVPLALAVPVGRVQ